MPPRLRHAARPRTRVPDALPPHLALDRTSGEAMHRQLYAAFRTAILDGAFAPGERLPSTRTLAGDLGVSRTTILQAFDRLVAEGYATARAGAGTRVAPALPRLGPRGARRRAGAPGVGAAPVGAAVVAPGLPPGADRPLRLSRAAAALVDEIGDWGVGYRAVPFAPGLPALDEFPVALWARLVARGWRRHGAALLGFTDARGYPPLREAIARYAVTARGVRCTPDQVVVVNGAQHGVDLLARVLLDPGDAAWVEHPGYRPVRAALRAAGAQLVRVPVDAEGIDVRAGERLAPRARLAFVTPSYQAPLGVALSLERRLTLLDWAARADAWVLEDDYNGEYRYDAPPLPSVQGLDRAGRVIYIGSFSKTLAPGLRVGYLVVPPALVDVLARARRAGDLHTPVPEQAALADFLADGHFARHVRRMRTLYQRRQHELLALAPALTHGLLELHAAPAGMRLLGLLPDGVDAVAVMRAAAARGVFVTPLSASAPHALTGGRGGLLLGYAAFPRDATHAALVTLGDVLRDEVTRARRAPAGRTAA